MRRKEKMYELILTGSGFMAGLVTALVLFRCGMGYATKFIYQIKEDIPLEKMGKQTDQDFSE